MSSKFKNLPATDAQGHVMVHAGKYARSAVLAVFEQMGGVKAMTDWAKKNPTDYYTKLFPKVIDREPPAPPEDESVEDLLHKLDREMIDVSPERDSEPTTEDDTSELATLVEEDNSPWPDAVDAVHEAVDD